MAVAKRSKLGDADGLLKAMLVLARTVEHVLENRVVEEIGQPLSKSKLQVLRLLGQRGAQSTTRIARFLGTSKPAVTQIMDALVQSRLVSRAKAPNDLRSIALRLTPKGRRLFSKVCDEQRHLIRSMAREAGGGDLGRWTNVLDHLTSALTRADRTFQEFCLQCGSHADGRCILVGGKANCVYLRHQGKVVSTPAPTRQKN